MMRQTWNLRKFPLLRPVNMQRKWDRVGELSRGSFASAAKFFCFFNSRRSSAYFYTKASRRFCLATQAFVAMSNPVVCPGDRAGSC